jgi:hypothetical protein
LTGIRTTSPQALDLMSTECQMGHLDSRLVRVFVDAGVWAVA